MHSPSYGRITNTYDIAMTNTAATSAATAIPFGTRHIRLVASQDCRVEYRAGATTAANGATPSGFFLPAGYVDIVQVNAGERVSCICDTATSGNLNVSEVSL